MAVSIITYTADGSTNQFSITFDYISQSHVVVKVNGSAAAFTFVNSSTIQTNTTPTAGQKVEIRRVTPVAALVDFTDGSTLFEADLDLADKQARFVAEEAKDIADDAKTTVDTNIGDINTVAGIASDVTTNASNISVIQSASANATAAATSATAAATSATSAATSATSASTDKTAAEAAKNLAETAKNSAFDASSFANIYKNNAATSETNAASSATAAATSATSAATSATSASTSATAAAASAASINNYSLPTASSSTLGGIKIGSGLSIDGSGVVTASGGGGSSLTVQDEGSALSTAATTMNFVGNGVTASGTGATKTITVTDTNTTYNIGDGGLSEKNFTTALKSKLDGIEANATADQTAAEIRALVESATDSNVFTDADHSKLNAIEANATADQTDAEIRAAVEAANDSNVFTDADHSKLNAIEANATADQTASEIKTAYESNSDTNAFTDAEKTKLSGIATSANNYVHPNHSGEVTSTADGAMVIADGVVDEANLKVSNAPTDGYVLTAQSGNTGGLTWAAASGGGGSGISNLVEDTTPQLGGDLDTNDKSIKFGDRSSSGVNELVFGDGDDLRIFHGTNNHSQIVEGGSGNLQIYASNLQLKSNAGADYLVATDGGAVELYHNSNKKAETTSSGLQTTGTLNVNGAYTLPTSDGSANQVLTAAGNGTTSWAAASGGGSLDLIDENYDGTSTKPSASGSNSVAIGKGASAQGTNHSIAIGRDAVASGAGLSVALLGTASGSQSLTVGHQSAASAGQSMAVGYQASAGASSSTAIGRAATTASGTQAMALGDSYASGADSLAAAISTNSSAYGALAGSAISLGKSAKANGARATAIGYESVSGGTDSVAIGRGANASSENSLAFGYKAKANVIGCAAFSAGIFGAEGDAQGRQYILRADTTDATATVLTTDNGNASVFNSPRVDSDTAIVFDGVITAMQNGAQAYAGWRVEGMIVNDGGTTTLVNSATTVIQNSSNWGMALSADNSNNILKITATGEAAHNIRWVANIRTVETTFA